MENSWWKSREPFPSEVGPTTRGIGPRCLKKAMKRRGYWNPRFYFFALPFTSHRSPLSERLEQASLAGKMSSKTILIALSIFRCGGDNSVHGRPSWERVPYDCSLQNTKDFAAWCKLVSRECRFNDRAGECGVVRYTTQFFVLDKAKELPIRIGSQTACTLSGCTS